MRERFLACDLRIGSANLWEGRRRMKKSRQETLADTGCFHKFWKGHNGEKVLRTDSEKRQYLSQLCAKQNDVVRANVKWHSYCLMSNHPHETGQAGWDVTVKNSRKKGIAAFGNWMRNAHSAYGVWYNRRKTRYGKVSSSRPRTTQIKSEPQILNAMFYGDANPVRAGIVTHPSKYKWSSYRFYAYGETNEFTAHLDPPAAYLALGNTPAARQKAYRSLVDAYLRKNGLLNDRVEAAEDDFSIYDSILDAIDAAIALAACRVPGPSG